MAGYGGTGAVKNRLIIPIEGITVSQFIEGKAKGWFKEGPTSKTLYAAIFSDPTKNGFEWNKWIFEWNKKGVEGKDWDFSDNTYFELNTGSK